MGRSIPKYSHQPVLAIISYCQQGVVSLMIMLMMETTKHWCWWHQLLLLPEEAAGVVCPRQVSNARWSAKTWKHLMKPSYGMILGLVKTTVPMGPEKKWRFMGVDHGFKPVSQSPVGKGLLLNMGKLESARNAGLTIHRCTSSPRLQQFLAQVGLLLFFPWSRFGSDQVK